MNSSGDIRGSWSCVSAIVDGKSLPEATRAALRLTLTADRYKTEKGSEVLFDSTYTLDPAKQPNQINIIGEGDLLGKEALGIYSLQGGSLQLCYTMPGGARPAAFESPAGSKAFLTVWKKQE
jgi:uncharacterized protein (TIGR03067 family)